MLYTGKYIIQVQINPRVTTHAYINHYQDLNKIILLGTFIILNC